MILVSEDERDKLRDLVQRADAYILALRQVVYSQQPEVRRLASEELNALGSAWLEARHVYVPDIPEVAYLSRK